MKKEEVLAKVKEAFGFVPNVLKMMSDNPGALQAYLVAQEALAAGGNFNEIERVVVDLAVSHYNGCEYCERAHAAMAKQLGLPESDIAALRSGKVPNDARLAALADSAWRILEKQGYLTSQDHERMKEEGITKVDRLELVAHIGLKIMTNYVNHIEATEIDSEFK